MTAKELWKIFDQGDFLTLENINQLIEDIQQGIHFLESRGETGGVLFKARLDLSMLKGRRDFLRGEL